MIEVGREIWGENGEKTEKLANFLQGLGWGHAENRTECDLHTPALQPPHFSNCAEAAIDFFFFQKFFGFA